MRKTKQPTDKQVKEWREKARKWDDLNEKIGKYYPDSEDVEQETPGDLCDIGEVAAMAFGYL